MPYENINYELPEADKTAIADKLQEIRDLLQPVAVNISTAEKYKRQAVNNKRIPFIQKTMEYMQQYPQLKPGFVDVQAYQNDVKLFHDMQELLQAVRVLEESMADIGFAAGSEAYRQALAFYESVKQARKHNIPGIDTIYEDLRTAFPRRGKQKVKDV